MSAGKVVRLVFGIIIILVAVALMVGGGAVIWIDRAHTDSEGFIISDTIQIERDSYAVVTGPIDIDETALKVLDWLGLVTAFKVEGSNNDPSKGLFAGVADESDLEGYLDDVDYDEMIWSDIGWLHFENVTYTNHPGSSEPASPTSQTFWKESEYGTGTRALEWETEVGSHSNVLMNDDGSAGLDLSAVFAVKAPGTLVWIGVGILLGGIVVLAVGGLMVFFAVRKPKIISGVG